MVTPFYHIGAVGYHLAHAISGCSTTCFPQPSWDPEATGPAVSVAKHEMAIEKAPSVGRPFVNTDIRVIGETGKECRPGEVGEIAVKGDQIMSEYLNDPDTTNATLKEGWLYTGDLGQMDDDGYLFVVDRKKDIIISGGENISSVEVESTLYKHPKIMEAAVIGIPDSKFGEGVCAVVVPREGQEIAEQEVLMYWCLKDLF